MKLAAMFSILILTVCGESNAQSNEAVRHAQLLDAIDLAGVRAQFPNADPQWVEWYFRKTQTAQRAYETGAYDSPATIARKLREQSDATATTLRARALNDEEAKLRAELAAIDAAEAAKIGEREQLAKAQQAVLEKKVAELEAQNAQMQKSIAELTAKQNGK